MQKTHAKELRESKRGHNQSYKHCEITLRHMRGTLHRSTLRPALVNSIHCIDLSPPAMQRTRGHSLQIPFIGTRGPAGVFTSQDQAHNKHSGLFANGNLIKFSHSCTLTPAWHLYGVSRERGAVLQNWSNITLQIQLHT